MDNTLLASIDDALAAFGEYQTALDDPEFACPYITLDRLEVAMRNLQDVFDDLPIAQRGVNK